MDHSRCIVVDNGSFECKAGFSGNMKPSTIFQPKIGIPSDTHEFGTKNEVGDNATKRRHSFLQLRQPHIKDQIIDNWDDMGVILQYCFSRPEIKGEKYPVLFTSSPLNPKENLEKLVEFYFEKLKVPYLNVSIDAVLALYFYGKTTGISVDSGNLFTHAVPVFEGYAMRQNIVKTPIGGETITEKLSDLVGQEQLKFNNLQLIRQIKEKYAFCSAYEKDATFSQNQMTNKQIISLPDGSDLELQKEPFLCSEVLFQANSAGIHQIVNQSIQKCDLDLRKQLYQNVFLSGGNSLLQGLSQRLELQVKDLAPQNMQTNVIANNGRQHAAWIGGSMFSQLDGMESMWISFEEYFDFGLTVVHRKCF